MGDKYKEKFGTDKNIFLYDMHDGKMLYALTQHSAYNRKYHPFLLCKCGPGDGVRDPSHVCLLIEHDKQVERFEQSKTKWTHFANIYEQKVPPQKYTESDHRNWADTMHLVSHTTVCIRLSYAEITLDLMFFIYVVLKQGSS